MLKGKQKKLDKNNNGRIDAEDFKLLKGSKKGMRMGGMLKAKSGKYVFDMVGVKPMSGLNKNKKKDGFLDDVFEKTVKKYGLKDPTKKK